MSLADMLIPELRPYINKEQSSPNTKIYMGVEGLKTTFEDIYETLQKEKIKRLYAISGVKLFKILPKYLPDWIKRREQLGVFTQMIAERGDTPTSYTSNTSRDVRFLPKGIMDLDCSIDIYGNKVACISMRDGEIYSAIIESTTITATLLQLFNLVWASTVPEK
jgi:hypothetical protein